MTDHEHDPLPPLDQAPTVPLPITRRTTMSRQPSEPTTVRQAGLIVALAVVAAFLGEVAAGYFGHEFFGWTGTLAAGVVLVGAWRVVLWKQARPSRGARQGAEY